MDTPGRNVGWEETWLVPRIVAWPGGLNRATVPSLNLGSVGPSSVRITRYWENGLDSKPCEGWLPRYGVPGSIRVTEWFRLCRFLAAGWRWNFDDHRIILEKPLLDILPLGGWDDPRPPGNACGFVVLSHYVAEVIEYSDSGGAFGSLKMKLQSRLVYFCHEEFVILDDRNSPAGYRSFRFMP